MPFASAASTAVPTADAADEAGAALRSALGRDPDLVFAFYSPHHAANAGELADALRRRFPDCPSVGVLGESVLADGKEFEDQPALALWAAAWDGVGVDAFHLDLEETPDGPTLFGWPDEMLDADAATSVMLCVGDPYTFPAIDLFLPRMNDDHPGLAVVGGMASSPMGAGTPSLFLDGEVREKGAIGVLLRGAAFKTVVSQGCRPVGRPLVVTKGQDNVILELGGQSPLDYLKGLLETVPAADKHLMQRGLLLGTAITEYRETFGRGDFLIRNLIGLDPRTGALAVTDRIRLGQTVQFHVRDAATATEDLRAMLADAGPAAGGLLFTCNGRGTRLFSVADHDAAAIQSVAGPLPVAGMFAAGEIGPVGGRNFMHGFTASAVLFT